ncbi:aquaporin Z [Paraburkholderia bonniea]|uniref:aquaporin Z n=1 Tax=Paraburkholderia bonniea TaxID=2152891 RepID=UPI001292695C|nr:aquaporin Z [Paraburkholderia bonniea]WJF90676.1 aquaporin Z [Paraburkholderia bonniea]WJF94673.1 aquaporin Z [Paraburkholderia bonniea]
MVRLGRRLLIEGVGTGWIVFIGCGSVVLNAGSILQGRSVLDVSLAFGLALMTVTYAFGRYSGGHFNPAVTVGFTVAQRFPVRDMVPYIAAQILGAVAGAALLAYVASGRPGFDLSASEFGANGYGEHSPGDYRLRSALVLELMMSFVFVTVCLMMARRKISRSVAPLVSSACMMLIYFVTIPVTNASINPARSTGPALFVGDWALDQLWLFWAAPMVGGVLAGMLYQRFWGLRTDRSGVFTPERGEAV